MMGAYALGIPKGNIGQATTRARSVLSGSQMIIPRPRTRNEKANNHTLSSIYDVFKLCGVYGDTVTS